MIGRPRPEKYLPVITVKQRMQIRKGADVDVQVHVRIGQPADYDTAAIKLPGEPMATRLAKKVAQALVLDPTHRYDLLRYGRYSGYIRVKGASYNSSSWGGGHELKVDFEIIGGPRVRTKQAPMEPLKSALLAARSITAELTIPESKPFVLVYDAFHVEHTKFFKDLYDAFEFGWLMNSVDKGVPIAVVHKGVMHYWHFDTLGKASLVRHLRWVRLRCESRGVRVKRTGMQIPSVQQALRP
jgi:hypothetical protein